jgi:hypothetical protein
MSRTQSIEAREWHESAPLACAIGSSKYKNLKLKKKEGKKRTRVVYRRIYSLIGHMYIVPCPIGPCLVSRL